MSPELLDNYNKNKQRIVVEKFKYNPFKADIFSLGFKIFNNNKFS